MARQGPEVLNTLASLSHTIHNSELEDCASHLAISALEMGWYMRQQLLRDSDRASTASSLQFCVPFVDFTLLKAVAPWVGAPPDLTKPEIARALAPNIPAQLVHERDTGCSIAMREWLLKYKQAIPERRMCSRAWTIHADFWMGPI